MMRLKLSGVNHRGENFMPSVGGKIISKKKSWSLEAERIRTKVKSVVHDHKSRKMRKAPGEEN